MDSTGPEVVSITVTSNSQDPTMVVPGDTITIALTTNEPILLPAIRLQNQEESPMITGGGSNWVYQYRVLENFGFTDTCALELAPFRPRDIAGNLGTEVSEFSDSAILTFTPDLEAPEVLAESINLQIISEESVLIEGIPDPIMMQTFSVSFDASEELGVAPTVDLGGRSFRFDASVGGQSWVGTATRPVGLSDATEAAPFALSIQDLGGNQTLYSANIDISTIPGPSGSPMSFALTSGIRDWIILDENGLQNGNEIRMITTADQFVTSEELSGPSNADNEHIQWNLGDDGVLEMNFLATGNRNLFTTQFFDGAGTRIPANLGAYRDGALVFDMQVDDYGSYGFVAVKADYFTVDPATNERTPAVCFCDQTISGRKGDGEFEKIIVPIAGILRDFETFLPESVSTGIVLFPDLTTQDSSAPITVRLRNIRWVASIDSEAPSPSAGTGAGAGCEVNTLPEISPEAELAASITVAEHTDAAPPNFGSTPLEIFTDSLMGDFSDLFTFENGAVGVGQENSNTSGQVRAGLVPLSDGRGMVIQFETGTEQMAVMGLGSDGRPGDAEAEPPVLAIPGANADLSAYENGLLQFDMRVNDFPDNNTANYVFKINTGIDAEANPTQDFEVSLGGRSQFPFQVWRTVRIDLSMPPWNGAAAQWDNVDLILQVFPEWGKAAGTEIQIDDIFLYPPAASVQ